MRHLPRVANGTSGRDGWRQSPLAATESLGMCHGPSKGTSQATVRSTRRDHASSSERSEHANRLCGVESSD